MQSENGTIRQLLPRASCRKKSQHDYFERSRLGNFNSTRMVSSSAVTCFVTLEYALVCLTLSPLLHLDAQIIVLCRYVYHNMLGTQKSLGSSGRNVGAACPTILS